LIYFAARVGLLWICKSDKTEWNIKNRAGRKEPAKKTYGYGKTNNYHFDWINCVDWGLPGLKAFKSNG